MTRSYPISCGDCLQEIIVDAPSWYEAMRRAVAWNGWYFINDIQGERVICPICATKRKEVKKN